MPPRNTAVEMTTRATVDGLPSSSSHSSSNEVSIPSISVTDARRAHFNHLAFPAFRLLVMAFLFTFFGIIQSSRAYTVIGSVFGAFIFSIAGVSFWVGCQGLIEAYKSMNENFPAGDARRRNLSVDMDDGKIRAVITDSRVVNDEYVEYRIDVTASGKAWAVWRRYSDFYRTFVLESEFTTSLSKNLLPQKRWFGSHLSSAFIEERKQDLNLYLQNVLEEHGARRVDKAIAAFFDM